MNDQNLRWILASTSPRRREILQHLGLCFEIITADTDETCTLSDPAAYVEEVARRKAEAVRDRMKDAGDFDASTCVLLAADTVVVSPDGKILGKPHDERAAEGMLSALSGRAHRVVSGVAVVAGGRTVTAPEITVVRFAPLSEDIIRRYVASGEPMDKAGAYGLQGISSLWVEGIDGDYFNVIGLPVHRLEYLLNGAFGLSLWQKKPGHAEEGEQQ